MIDFKNKSPKILVVGDLMIDNYLWGSCNRISPEAPVQIVNIDTETKVLGGAGNVVNNLKELGAKVDIISVLGNDENSQELKKLLKNNDINTQFLITQNDRISSKKSRIIASQQQVVRYDQESTTNINQETEELVLNLFLSLIKDYDIVLISDYGKGLLTKQLTPSIIKIANKHNKKILIDPKGSDYSKYTGAYLLTPNINEASEATQINIIDDESLSQAIIKLKVECNLNISLITLSEKGVAIYDKTLRIHSTIAKEVFDVTGAGDTVLASLGFALGLGYSIDESVEFSNLAAGVVIGKFGSATTSLNEIIEYESSINKSSSEKHIKTFDEILQLSIKFKEKDKKIIFTNGCFDLIHSGHIKYLEAAKSFGDILIVGINSDRSTANLKGSNRPINTQNDRAYIIAALEVVDYVVIFDEDTPYNLIQAIVPNVLVKGGDYVGKEVIGHKIVDEVKLVEFIKGKSSSLTIERIQKGTNYAITH
jgi:D-beta-D-heptose 7-phosphate kinase / D-beta-D-heptose 1-phosphate adenosyltransferase